MSDELERMRALMPDWNLDDRDERGAARDILVAIDAYRHPARRAGPSPPANDEELIEFLAREEAGDAMLLARLFVGKIAYDHADRTWYFWQGHFWQPDTTACVQSLVHDKLAGTYLKAAASLRAASNTAASEACIVRARKLGMQNRIAHVLILAGALPELALVGDEWDRDPWLLGCANGVLDLRTAELAAGRPGDYIRLVAPTPWEGLEAPATRWERFLDEIFGGDAELIAFVKRLLGYGLTGLAIEHILPVAWGEDGRNGKDTLFSTLHAILGPLAGPIDASILIDRPAGGEAATPGLYSLRHKRIVWAAETGEGARLNSGQVKLLTGGAAFQARPLYGRPVTISPGYLPWLITNYKPHAPADDEALWERVKLIPFTQRFVDEPHAANEHRRDPYLAVKLADEAPGILASLVLGGLDWQNNGLRPPEIVKLATREYRSGEDNFQFFLDECCTLQPELRAQSGQLYQSYVNHSQGLYIKPMSHTAFSLRLKKKFDSIRTGRTWYIGIGLNRE